MSTLKLVKFSFLLVLLGACAQGSSGFSARGFVGGQWVDQRVDSKIASYYVSHYLVGERSNSQWDERIDRLRAFKAKPIIDRALLKRVGDEYSLDLAALYFAEHLLHDRVHRSFRAAFDVNLMRLRSASPEERASLVRRYDRYELVFVPGYLYQRHPFTGADFAAPRAALSKYGVTHRFVATDEDGPIEDNAEKIFIELARRADSPKQLIVVSASKSGAEVALALSRMQPKPARQIAAWINIVGTLQGSPLADDSLFQQSEEQIGRVDAAGVESLTTQRSRERFRWFTIPSHVLVINYFGVPLTGSLSSLAREGFEQLRKHGPNDGLSLLPDLVMPGGINVVEIGRDHFLLEEDIDLRTIAMAVTIFDWLADQKRLEQVVTN